MAKIDVAKGVTTIPSVSASDDVYILEGSAEIDGGVDLSGINSADMRVMFPFNGNLGTTAAPLKLNADVFWYGAGGGTCVWESNGLADDISDLLILPKGCNGHMKAQTIGTVTNSHIYAGQFTCSVDVALTNIYQGGGITRIYDDGGVADPTLINLMGGECRLHRGCTTANVYGGQLILEGTNENAITTLTIGNGGNVNLLYSGTITTLNCWGSVPSTLQLSSGAITITTLNINAELSGAEDFINHPRLTIGTTNRFYRE